MKRETINYIHSLLTAHKDKLWEEVQAIGREMEHADNRGECWNRGKAKRDEWDEADAALKDFENHDWQGGLSMAEYIKRDEALKALLQVSAPTPSESYTVEKCIDKINDVPAAEVAPVRHGYWKQNPKMRSQYSCSVCGRCIEDEQCNPKQFFLYCHCGAKMGSEPSAASGR